MRAFCLCLVLALTVLAAGCAEENSSNDSATRMEEAVEMSDIQQTSQPASAGRSAPAPQNTMPRVAQQTPKLIKRATLRFRVEDYEPARRAVEQQVEQYDAYVASENESRSGERVENRVVVRVPAAEFDALLDALAGLAADGEMDAREMNVQDVTEEFVDLQARLRARRAVEARYLDLLERASSVEDILRVEQQLGQVREEIERAQGRIDFLNDRAALSTINLTFYHVSDPPTLASGPGFFSQAGDAFAQGWQGLLELLLVAINLWPLLLLAIVGWLAVRAYRRRRAPAAPVSSEASSS